MEIKSFYELDTGTWTYLLADTESRKAAIIDPVWLYDPISGMADCGFIDRVLDAADEAGFKIEWVLETHAHADHLTGAGQIKERTGAKLACGRGICAVQQAFAPVFNMADFAADGRQFDRLLVEGDIIELGREKVHVMETPGHTGDSVTYLAGDAAFIGDTLFAPSFGTARCDFPGGDASQLFESIQRLYGLPAQTRLFLCHDYPETGKKPVRDITVEESRRNNIHLNLKTDKAAFVSMRTQRDSQLGLPRLILPSLQINIRGGAAPEPDSNGVTYLRMPFNRSMAELMKGVIE